VVSGHYSYFACVNSAMGQEERGDHGIRHLKVDAVGRTTAGYRRWASADADVRVLVRCMSTDDVGIRLVQEMKAATVGGLGPRREVCC